MAPAGRSFRKWLRGRRLSQWRLFSRRFSQWTLRDWNRENTVAVAAYLLLASVIPVLKLMECLYLRFFLDSDKHNFDHHEPLELHPSHVLLRSHAWRVLTTSLRAELYYL